MEPEDTKSFESGFESNSCSSCGQLAVITDEDASKRELSPIIEGNEDRSSVGKAPQEAHPREVEVQKQSCLCTKQGKGKVKGCLSVEATNPIFAHYMTEDHANSSSSYVEDSNLFTHQSCTGDETQPLPCHLATVESYGAQFETEEMLNTGTDEVHESDRANDPGPYIEGSGEEPVGNIADAPAMNSDNDSSLPHALMWRLPTANSGYIPSNFTTSATSSGYGSEEGYTSGYNYTSRLLSTSSCATDTSSGSGCCYAPSTTPSSGYVSETGFSRNKRGSLTSQVSCDTPCGIQPAQLGSEGCWAHSDCVEGTTGLVAESGKNSGNCSGTDSSTAGPLQRETHQLHLAHCSVITPGTVVDSSLIHHILSLGNSGSPDISSYFIDYLAHPNTDVQLTSILAMRFIMTDPSIQSTLKGLLTGPQVNEDHLTMVAKALVYGFEQAKVNAQALLHGHYRGSGGNVS